MLDQGPCSALRKGSPRRQSKAEGGTGQSGKESQRHLTQPLWLSVQDSRQAGVAVSVSFSSLSWSSSLLLWLHSCGCLLNKGLSLSSRVLPQDKALWPLEADPSSARHWNQLAGLSGL